jgi:2-polyprenyl-3-methyl-5-hydroxy-6-metoxy-1,4-benzoquinol methylase
MEDFMSALAQVAASQPSEDAGALPFDETKAAGFEERMVDTLNGAALALMISIGHRTGLFDALDRVPPVTSAELAAHAGLNERYVREWLGALSAARVVKFDAASRRYSLPAEHAACLTRRATPGNLAVFAQYVPVLGGVEDDIVHCFEHGGGVPYDRYPRFHEVMAEDSGQTVLPALFDHILPLAGGIEARLEAGIRVLDVGCGRGRALMMMAERYPNSTFVGYDLSGDAVNWANAEARRQGLSNLHFEARDLSNFDRDAEPASFEFVTTFDAIHDQADPLAVLKGIRRTLTDDGVYLAQDINGSSHVHHNLDHPIGTLLYTISCLHCMTVSLAQDGAGLGAMWGREKARELFAEAGFANTEVNELAHDIQNCYYLCRP